MKRLDRPLHRSLIIGLLLSMIIGAAYHAQQIQAAPNAPTLEITKSIDGNLSEVESGEPFTYKLAYRCVSISENCLNAEITDALPAPLEFVSLTSNPTHVDTASYDSGSNTITFDMVDPLPAGSTGFVRIEAQFPAGTLPGTLATNTATFDADNGGPSPSNPVDIISTGVFEMFPRKEIVNTDVIIGFPIDFNVELCSPDSRGGVNLTNVAFVDQLPPEATFVTAEGTDGVDWTYDSGLHQLTFTNLPDATPAGCLSRSVTVIHNSAPSGTQTNTLTVTGTPEGCDGSITPLPAYCNGITGDIPLGPIGVDYEVDPPFAEGTTGKTSYSASTFNGRSSELNSGAVTSALPGEAVTYTVSARNSGYLTLTNAMLTDTIPTEIMVTRFTVPLAEDATVSGFYQTNDTGWQPLPGNPYAATTAVDVSSLGLGAGDFITTLAWDFGQLAPQSNRWAATVTGIVDPTLPAGTTFQNCADFSADSTDGLQTGQNCNTVRVVNPRSIPRVTKSNNTGPYLPGDEFDFTISLRNDQVAHQDFIDPILVDVLPAGIELIPSAIRYVGTASGFVTPTQTIINDSPNPGETTIRWEWPGNLAPGDEVSMEIGVQVSDDTTPGRYHNTGVAFSNNPANTNIYGCEGQPTEYTDVNDLDNDGDTTELTCQNPSSEGFADVSVFLAMDSRKQVQGARDNRFQELGLTYPGGELNWKIAITNTSNVPMTDIVLYDILSYIGDTGVIDPQARGSEWRPNMLGPVVIPGGIPATVYYSQELNPCRPEIANISGCVDDWTTVFPDDPGTVQAIKFELCDAGGCYEMPIDSSIEFTWPMVAPNDAPTDASCETAYDAATYQQFKSSNPACSIAWNSFGFTGGGSGETLLAAEPLRVGIRVSDSPRFLLGDFVWLDVAGVGQDHLQQLTEQNLWGVNGVRVELWNADTDAPYDLNNDSVGDFRYTSPDHNGRDGYYLFGDLPAGNYFLRFFPPAGYSTSIANQGGDDAADSDGETSGVDATYGTYLQTADIALSADDLTWDQGLGLPTDYGDLPFDGVNYTYPVTTTNTISPALAARHIIVPDLMLGATVDAEIDGQPTIDADGDDNATDDEDGIVFTTPIIPGNQACLEVTATTTQTEAANLSAWFDFNGDGSLTGSGEQIFADVQPSSGTPNGVGVYEHCFNVPASAAHNGTLYSRFRLSTVPGLASTGTATDGEVEDYAVRLACVGNYVYDDNDRDNLQSAGDLGIDGVAVNLVWGGPDGLLSTTGDNRSYATTTDSNGEYHFCGLMSDVGDNGDDEYQISIPTLPGFTTTADQGGDDTLDSDGDSSGNGPVFTVPMPLTTDDTAANDNSYEGYPDDQDDLRFDFGFIIEYDWGDLPDGDGTGVSFPTNNTNGGEGTGPSHQLVTDLYLGDCVDGETNGQPSAAGSADQDDANAGALVSPNTGTCAGDDDEDGIVFATPLVPGHQACVHVSAQTAAAQGARISAWLDLNADGDLDNNDSIDRMLNNRRANSHMTDLGGGIYEYCFTVPASSTHDGTLYSRFRLSTEWINSAVSNEPDGEVEDYALETSCVGNYIFDDNDRDNTQSAGDTPIENLTVNLVWGGADGVISTASDNITYTTSTDSNGKYHFCGLILDGQDAGTSADEYQISVPTFPSDIVTADQGGNDALDSDGDANGRSPIFDLSSMNTDDATNDTSGSGSGNSGLPDDQDDLSFDFGFQVEYDYGDLPDDDTSGVVADNYATNDTDGASEGVGPSHRIVEDMYLGSCVDAEDDGQSSAIDTASADDSTVGVLLAIGGTCTGSDDEDGVVFTTPVIPGEQACVSVTATTAAAQAANLFGWVDFSSNGSLTDSGEAIIAGVAVNSGTNLGGGVYEHCFAVPASASHDGTMYSRFRLSTDSGLTPFGIATNGEVEDYALTTYCVGNYVWDDNGDGLQNSHSTDVGLNGIDVNLVWGGADGLISTSADNITHTTTTDSNGIYHVCGLIVDGGDADTTADEYRINIPTAPGDVITTDAGADDALDNDGDANGFGPIFSVPGPNTNTDDATNDTSDGSGSGIADAQDDLAFDFAFRVEYDWGDLPDSDAGVGANSYGTNNTDGGEGSGPVHQIIADTYLGNCVDGEDDGQPSATGSANLDDTGAGVMVTGAGTCTGSDDEDGIVFATPLVPGTSACVHVTASTATAQAANVYGWADLNANGYLTDTNEAIIAGVAANSGTDLGGGVYEHCFNVPASTAHSDTLYSRFRLSTDGGLTPYGAATNGEVEDYALTTYCVGNYVWDDNGDGLQNSHATDIGLSGIDVNLVWGGADGLISTSADNITHTTTTDSNGIYHVCGLIADGGDADSTADEYQISIPTAPGDVITANAGGDDALDNDGDANGFGPIFSVPGPNTNADNATNDISDGSGSGIADAQDDLAFDFAFRIEYDWGDLPDGDAGVGANSYGTNNTDGGEGTGPVHQIIADTYLGSCVDGEDNGQPSATGAANLDDTGVGAMVAGAGTCTGSDDEDGIVFATPLVPGNSACIHVTASTAAAQAANVYGWADLNANGYLTDTNEAIIAGVAANSGTNLGGGVYEHCFSVPASTTHSDTLYSRFRLSTDGGLTPYGAATNGEVEDYAQALQCVGNYVFDDNDLNDTQSAGDMGINGVQVNLVWGGADGLVSTTGDNTTYTTTTDINGLYHFCGLVIDGQDGDTSADEYQLVIPTTPGSVVTADQGGDDALDSDGDASGNGPIFDLATMNTDDAPNDTSGSGGSEIADAQDDLSFDFGFVVEYDWGDLPDDDTTGLATNNYPTNIINGAGEGVGPSHQLISGYYLGNCVDGEIDGQPSAIGSADSDDNTLGNTSAAFGTCVGNDDEDGVVFTTPLIPNETACLHITASDVTANLFAFIDWNEDGTLDTATERMIAGAVNSGTFVSASTYEHCFTVPASATMGSTLYSRFRYSTDADLDATGPASNGEVEDYATSLACVGNFVFMDNGGMPYRQDSADTGLGGIAVNLVWGGPDGIVGAGGDDVTYNTTTSSSAASLGEYHFCGLPSDTNGDSTPDEYQIQIPTPPASLIPANLGSDAVDSDGMLSGGAAVAPVFTIANANGMIENEAGTHGSLIPTGSDDNSSDLTFDFGFEQILGAIGNYVWVDENSDGLQDAGEPGIPNVTVILLDATNTPIMTTTTDANGGYLFPELPVGTYSVDVVESTIPSGMSQTTTSTNTGGDFGNQDHSGNGYSVTIGNGEPLENLTADFGYNYNPTDDVNDPSGSPTAGLGDRVWYDTDADGKQDADEIGIYNVCVELFSAGPDGFFNTGADNRYGTSDDDSVSLGTQNTDYTGYYFFDNLTPGSYVVQVCQSSLDASGPLDGLSQTGDPDHFGSAETGAYGENDNLSTTPIILGPGDVFLNVDFGYDGGTVGSIGDTVFFDTDADGNGPSMTAIDDASAVTQGAGGSADSADSGIAGVTVSLIRDLDGDGIYDAGEPIIATTQTDENGQYLFSGLPVDDGGGDSDADYIVWVNDTNNVLDGMEQTYDDDGAAGTPNQSAVAISSGSPDARDQDFGYSESIPQGSIGDTIWNDVDNSGTSTPDGGEPGIPNVTVNLFADEDGDGVADDINGDGIVDASDAIATTTTDENGNYLFSGLPLGSYLVEVVDETLPAGFSSSPTYDPDGGTPANVGATVTLSETNPTNREQDFSYTASNTSLSSIGDQIWGDLANDGNATLDSVDVPLAGVEVTLTDGSGGTQTTTTDENGFYLFNNLPANSYTVTVNTATLPAGYSTTPSFDPDLTMDSVVTYTLGTSEHERARDFSYPPTAPEGMIGDTVWLDIDGDGNGPNDEGTSGGDNNEPGIADACVHLYQDLGAIGTYEPGTDVLLATTVTDENGNYLFSGLSLDDSGGDSDFDYVVVVDKACLPSYVNPESTYDEDAPTTDSISFTSLSAASFSTGSHVDLDQDFGYEPATALGTIGDTIWFDVDGLGGNTPDAGEQGLEGVIVLLTDDKGNTWTTTTDENGNYQFGDLPLSTTYTVTVSASNFASDGVLEGMSNTYDPDDNDDNTGVGITLTDSAPVNLDQDFSYAGAAGQLGNLVWFDNNADGNDDSGTAGSGEAPIGNVTIDLYRDLDCDGLIDAGEPLFGSTTTLGAVDAVAHGTNGVYDFDGLPVSGSGPSDGSCWAVDVTDVNDELVGLWKSSGSQGTDDNSQIDPYTDTGLGALQLTAGNPSNLTADFGYYLYPAAVGNFVWFDINYDGVQDAGEFGINNLTTTLKIDYPDGTTITVSMLTGDNPATAAVERGWYSFANLLIDEDYAASTGTSTASGTQPALTLSVDTARYTITKLDDAAATDMTDADNPAGVAALATMGMFDATQNVTPTLESDPVASYDFGVVSVELGDLPDIYNTLVSNSGAQHIIFPDDDGDNMPDVTGAIWSGVLVDIETDGQGGGDFGGSEGDDDDLIDDEDGLILPPQTSLIEGNNVTFTVTLRSRGIQMADYGLWIDWNGDGDFLGTNEFLNMNDVNINTLVSGDLYETTFTLQTVVPSGTVMHPGWIYVRGRVFEANASVTRDVAVAAHRGLAGNGEVEDFAFRMISPTAVGLSSAETTQTSTNIVTLLATIMLSATLLFVLYKRNNTDKQSS